MGSNNNAILDLIRSGGAISRVQLAVRSGLTEASVSRIVKQLLAEGIIAETGRAASTGGKRPTLLQLDPTSRHAIGLFISETRVELILTDLAGGVVASGESRGMARNSRQELVADAAEAITRLIAESDVDPDSILGIGVAIPGRQALSSVATRLHPSDYAEWSWHLLERDLGEATGRPIAVENDSTCAAIGEFWSSRTPTGKDFAVVNISNGIGFGLVSGGDVYRGASSNVGEIGHMVLDINGPHCACGNRGCLETLASPPRVVEHALADTALAERLGLSGRGEDIPDDYERIVIAATAGDQAAAALVVAAARLVGIALISLTNVLDLERIVLTGPALDHIGGLYVDTVADELRNHAYVRDVHPTEVSLSPSARHGAALGAATLIIHDKLAAVRRPRETWIAG